jgi:ribonuclease HI
MCESEYETITICGIIKNLRFNLNSFPDISFLINVVMIDFPRTWRMLLSRELVVTLGGSLKMNESSSIIWPHPKGGFNTLYKEPFTRCLVEPPRGSMDQTFFLDDRMGNLFTVDPSFKREPHHNPNGTWNLDLDGPHSILGLAICGILTAPSRETFYFSYRLEYNCTNNVVKYKDFLIGLNLAIDRKIKCIRVIRDYDLIVCQISLKFYTKNERIKKYRYLVRDAMNYFEEIPIEVVPREENHIVDSLALSGYTLQPCEGPLQYLRNMEVVFRPSVPENVEN